MTFLGCERPRSSNPATCGITPRLWSLGGPVVRPDPWVRPMTSRRFVSRRVRWFFADMPLILPVALIVGLVWR